MFNCKMVWHFVHMHTCVIFAFVDSCLFIVSISLRYNIKIVVLHCFSCSYWYNRQPWWWLHTVDLGRNVRSWMWNFKFARGVIAHQHQDRYLPKWAIPRKLNNCQIHHIYKTKAHYANIIGGISMKKVIWYK